MNRKWPLLFIVIAIFIAIPSNALNIKKPPTKTVLTYKDLPCSEEDQEKIYHIISTMAEKGWISLWRQENELRAIGKSIDSVHPLKFLAVIFKHPYLKSCMNQIWKDRFKRNGFLEGLIPNLQTEATAKRLQIYLKDFSTDIGVDAEYVRSYCDNEQWENLVYFLIYS